MGKGFGKMQVLFLSLLLVGAVSGATKTPTGSSSHPTSATSCPVTTHPTAIGYGRKYTPAVNLPRGGGTAPPTTRAPATVNPTTSPVTRAPTTTWPSLAPT